MRSLTVVTHERDDAVVQKNSKLIFFFTDRTENKN